MFWLMAAMAGTTDARSEPVWMSTGSGPPVCVSFLPEAKSFKSKDQAGWQTVRGHLEEGAVTRAVEVLGTLKPHPVGRVIRAAAYLRGEGVAIDLEPLLDRYDGDACLHVLAAHIALKEGHSQEMSFHVKRASAIWPTHPDVVAMSLLVAPDRLARLKELLVERPDDPSLLAMHVRFATEEGALQDAVVSLGKLVALGQSERKAELMSLSLRAGEIDAYLRAAIPGHPVKVLPVSDGDMAAAYYTYLGMEGPRQHLWAILETSEGDLSCELDVSNAPMTILNFVGLARGDQPWSFRGVPQDRPLYDGTVFHRVIPEFMIQGGDPEGDGRGSPGYRFADEPAPRANLDRGGLLAMANSGADSNGSQFFITEAPAPHLNGKHTIFGNCDPTTLRRVKSIARVPAGAANRPTSPVTVEHVRFEVR